jgi:hypothetical protein
MTSKAPITEERISRALYLDSGLELGTPRTHIAFLLPEALWRPVRVAWWQGKEAAIIGGDEMGNYLLRLSDGSVRLWIHASQQHEPIASSVHAFYRQLVPGGF